MAVKEIVFHTDQVPQIAGAFCREQLMEVMFAFRVSEEHGTVMQWSVL